MTSETPRSDSLSVSVCAKGAVRVVSLKGSAAAEHVQELEARLRELAAASGRLVVDVSELKFLSSAGLGAIIAAHRICRAQGGALCLVQPREGVAQVLRITHLDQLIQTYPSVESACAALSAGMG